MHRIVDTNNHIQTKEIYPRITNHISLISELKRKERLLLLVEKEYQSQVSQVFWDKLKKELSKKFGNFTIVLYETNKDTLNSVYYDDLEKKLSKKTLKRLFENSSLCLDFLATGEGFYKKNLQVFSKVKRVILGRLFLDNWHLFSYNEKQIRTICNQTNKTRKHLQKKKVFQMKDLLLKVKNGINLYSGPVKFPSGFKPGDVRILPLDMVTILTKNSRVQNIFPTRIEINGKLKLEKGLYEIMTERNKVGYGKLSLEIQNNQVTKSSLNYMTVDQKSKFRIVHVSFGTNPFIRTHKKRVEIAERKYGWVCLGIEDSKNTHVDICFEYRLIRLESKLFSRLFQV